MQQMKKILDKGGTPVFTTYAVEIGDSLWNALYAYASSNAYSINGVFEEDNQKFAVLQDADNKYYRLDFSVDEAAGFVPAENLVELTDYEPATEPQFSAEAVAAYAASVEAETESKEEPAEEAASEEEVVETPAEEPVAEEEAPAEEPVSYVLDEIPEYIELQTQFNAAQQQIAELQEQISTLTTENQELTAFKAGIDRKAKEELINQFYMLSDADKKDCIDNIDTYSLDDIEAKLSIICVRNKVSFDLDKPGTAGQPKTFNLNSIDTTQSQAMPAWIQRVKDVAKNSNI